MSNNPLYLFHISRTSADAPQWLLKKIAALCEKGRLEETSSAIAFYAVIAHSPAQHGRYETFHFSAREDMEEAYRLFEELANEWNRTLPEDEHTVYRGTELDEVYKLIRKDLL